MRSGHNTSDLAVTSLKLKGGSLLDSAGNAALLSGAANYNPAGTLKIDTVTSTAAPVVTTALANDTGSSSSDKVTSNAALTGTADPNSIVHFTIDGTAIAATATANASGVWSYTPTGLSDGQHTIVASETNAGGATGTASLAFTLDTKGTVPVFTGGAMSNGQVTVTGTAEAGSTLSIYDGNSWAGFATAGSDGSSLHDAGDTTVSHSFGAIATDLAGNTGKAAGYVVSPGAAVAPAVTARLASDTGASATDKVTSSAIFTGTADPNSVVKFTVDGTAIAATATANASGVWTFAPTALGDGAHTIVASETNAAGATGTASLAFTLDTTGTAPVFTGGVLANGQVTVTGTAEAGSTLSIYDGSSWAGFANAGSDGKFSFTMAGNTTVSHTFGAIATDLAGNTGKAAGYVVSPGVPASVPTVTEKLVSDTGASASDKITSNAALSGTADPNSVVHFTIDGTAITATATANASGVWSYSPTGLSDGQHTIVASETNAGGATGSASLTFTLDTKAPNPVFTSAVQANGQVTLGGTSEAGSTLSIYDGNSWLGFATTGSNGTFSFTAAASNLAHSYGAIATDLAGIEGKTIGKLLLGSSGGIRSAAPRATIP